MLDCRNLCETDTMIQWRDQMQQKGQEGSLLYRRKRGREPSQDAEGADSYFRCRLAMRF